MSEMTSAGLDAVLLREEVEAFLYEEAARLDRRDYQGWHALFAADGIYWIPSNDDDVDPSRQVSIVYDEPGPLRERVWRLDSGLAYAQEPRSRSLHLVSNVSVSEASADELDVRSAFVITEFRRGRQFLYSGRYEHRLRRRGDGLEIVLKKVLLIDNDGHLGNVSLPL